jgi:hypothetical protein
VLGVGAAVLVAASPACADVILHPEADIGHGYAPAGLRVADINGDGHDDLVVARTTLEIWLGDGTGAFSRSYQSPEDAGRQPAPPADFDGDGNLDAAWIDPAGNVVVRTGDGAGHLGSTAWSPPADPAPPSGPDNPMWMTAADFNGDGRADLAVAYAGNTFHGGVRVFLGQSNGTFADGLRYVFPTSTIVFGIDWADVDDDGARDLVLATSDHGLMVARGQLTGGVPNGAFADPAGSDTGSVRRLYTDDFDGDGFVDDVVYARDASLFERTGSATGLGTETPVDTLPGPSVRQLIAADLDDDGFLDVAAVGFGDVVRVLSGTGNGFEDAESFPARDSADLWWLDVGDLVEDGVDDLVVSDASFDDSVYLMRNSPFATFDPDAVDFGDVQSVKAANVQIGNAGIAPLRITGIDVEGTAFSLAGQDCPQTLASGDSCEATARFGPPAIGAYDGTLVLSSNDSDGDLGVQLRGQRLPPLTRTPVSRPPGPTPSAPPFSPPTRRQAVTAAADTVRGSLIGMGLARLAPVHEFSFTFAAPGPGTEVVTVAAKGKAKPIVVATGKRTFAKAGRGKITVRFTSRGRRLLRHARTITLTVKSTFKPRSGKALSVAKKATLRR